jgi:hypothetical protein
MMCRTPNRKLDAMTTWPLAMVLALGLAYGGPGRPVAAAESLAVGMRQQAEAVLQYAREQGYRNIGVLKFQIKKGDKISGRAGTLNVDLTNSLQAALLLTEDPKRPVGLVRDASEVASKIDGADHTTAAGKAKLFAAKYPLLWNDEKVPVDAFVSGVAVVRPDFRTLSVVVCVIPREGEPKVLRQFVVSMDEKLLIGTGTSFRLRGAGDGGKFTSQKANSTRQQIDDAIQSALGTAVGDEKPPIQQPDAPVALQVFYDDVEVPLQTGAQGELRIAEPQPGQRVRFVVTKKDKGPTRYGFVLKINGDSTFKHERNADDKCTKWILKNDFPVHNILGFQGNNQDAGPFVIRSPEESQLAEAKYGKDVGQISFVVFQEAAGKALPPDPPDLPPGDLPPDTKPGTPAPPAKDPTPPVKDPTPPAKGTTPPANADSASGDAEDLAAIQLGIKPAKNAKSLEDAQQLTRSAADKVNKAPLQGLIEEGEGRIANGVKIIPFQFDPVPKIAQTIVYYSPKR